MCVLVVIILITFGAPAQISSDNTGAIEGTVSTQKGEVRLPGVVVSVRDAADAAVAEVL
jgi:hypothetical protein